MKFLITGEIDSIAIQQRLQWVHAIPVSLLLYRSKVSAGFPSPAEEYVEKRLDPSEFLIDQKDATFFITIQGYSMIDIGLHYQAIKLW